MRQTPQLNIYMLDEDINTKDASSSPNPPYHPLEPSYFDDLNYGYDSDQEPRRWYKQGTRLA